MQAEQGARGREEGVKAKGYFCLSTLRAPLSAGMEARPFFDILKHSH
jgi:hypothetical protein